MRPSAVLLPQPVEDPVLVPPLEHLVLEGDVVGDGRKRLEPRHAAIVGGALAQARDGNKGPSDGVA